MWHLLFFYKKIILWWDATSGWTFIFYFIFGSSGYNFLFLFLFFRPQKLRKRKGRKSTRVAGEEENGSPSPGRSRRDKRLMLRIGRAWSISCRPFSFLSSSRRWGDRFLGYFPSGRGGHKKQEKGFNRWPPITKNDWPLTAKEQIFQEPLNLSWTSLSFGRLFFLFCL